MSTALEKLDQFEYQQFSAEAGEETASVLKPGLGDYVGIFLCCGAVLLFELALTRIFAVMLWAHLAFMVVGTALFGFGLSGVYLALKRQQSGSQRPSIAPLCLFLTFFMIGAYLTITKVPFTMWQFQQNPMNYLYLAVWYIALVVPFFFAGLIVAKLLSAYPKEASRLYGMDLVGAAIGALALIPLIPLMGGEGLIVFSALLAAVSGLAFSASGSGSIGGFFRSSLLIKSSLLAVVVALAFIVPNADEWMPLNYHQTKRRFKKAMNENKIFETRWSPLSRVDIAKFRHNFYDIWIDGGTNESAIFGWSGEYEKLKPMRWSSIGAVHFLKHGTDQNVMIIGPSGGKEVLFALSRGARHVDAVELDPSIVHFVNQPDIAAFMGNLYQHERVTLTNDEGRAFITRQPPNSYDIIQFVNNYTPVAIAAGALNLSATYLLTKEAIHDYLDSLTDDGILALHRGATLRVALTAIEALRERGVENPENHLMITAGEVPFFEGFFLKKSPWTKEEEVKIHQYMRIRPRVGGKTFLWTPFHRERKNLYSKVLSSTPEQQKEYYTSLGVNLFPATDDRPFMEHYLRFGSEELSPELPSEFKSRNARKWRGIIPRGDFPYVAILVESALLSLLFVVTPLVLFARGSTHSKRSIGFLGYFAALGFGFIVAEICLMKRYVLFLGNPVYSINTVLVVILLGAGIGSLSSEKLFTGSTRRAIGIAVISVAVLLTLETLFAPMVFRATLGLPFYARIAVASLLLFPLGFTMGLPFPLGLRMISEFAENDEERRRLTAWAWGMNGYTTVIGSALTVFISLFFGFKIALVTAITTYLLGLVAMRWGTR